METNGLTFFVCVFKPKVNSTLINCGFTFYVHHVP